MISLQTVLHCELTTKCTRSLHPTFLVLHISCHGLSLRVCHIIYEVWILRELEKARYLTTFWFEWDMLKIISIFRRGRRVSSYPLMFLSEFSFGPLSLSITTFQVLLKWGRYHDGCLDAQIRAEVINHHVQEILKICMFWFQVVMQSGSHHFEWSRSYDYLVGSPIRS